MKDVFMTSCMSFLYESIYIWNNKFTFPGCVFLPKDPHPKINEYHTLLCGMSGIMYRW